MQLQVDKIHLSWELCAVREKLRAWEIWWSSLQGKQWWDAKPNIEVYSEVEAPELADKFSHKQNLSCGEEEEEEVERTQDQKGPRKKRRKRQTMHVQNNLDATVDAE